MAKKNLFDFPNSESIKTRLGKSKAGEYENFGEFVSEHFQDKKNVSPKQFVNEFSEIFEAFGLKFIGDIFSRLFSNNKDFSERVSTLWDKKAISVKKEVVEDEVSRDTEDATPDNELTFEQQAFVDAQKLQEDISEKPTEEEPTEEEPTEEKPTEEVQEESSEVLPEENIASPEVEEAQEEIEVSSEEVLETQLKTYKVAELRFIAQINGVDVSKLTSKQSIVDKLLTVENLVLTNE